MNKGILAALGIVIVIAIASYLLLTRESPDRPGPATSNETAAAPKSPPAPTESPGPGSVPPAIPSPPPTPAPPPTTEPDTSRIDGKTHLNHPIQIARLMHSPSTTAEFDVTAVGTALRYYRMVFKENPVGSLNEEIISQLIGNNPKKIVVIPPDHPDINARGELLDRWGKPYFFHGLTRTAMDVWSAGPDGKFGSPDDIKLGADTEVDENLGLSFDP